MRTIDEMEVIKSELRDSPILTDTEAFEENCPNTYKWLMEEKLPYQDKLPISDDDIEEMKKELENTSLEDLQLMKGLIEQELEKRSKV